MIEEGEALQATIAESGNGIGLCQLVQLRDLQGRLAELEPMLRGIRDHHPALRETHALALARTGRLDELRILLGSWGEQPDLLHDYLWLFLAPLRAEVWALLGDRAAARDLHDALAPYADRLAISVPVGFHGSVRLSLGRLAAVLGDTERPATTCSRRAGSTRSSASRRGCVAPMSSSPASDPPQGVAVPWTASACRRKARRVRRGSIQRTGAGRRPA